MNLTVGIAMKLLDSYYAKVGDCDVFDVALSFGIKINWVVEAGCHDGTDTVLINSKLNPSQIYAFEPDPSAFARAQALFERSLNNVSLFPFGLSDENRVLYFKFPNDIKGTGLTILSTEGDVSVSVKRFDDVVQDLNFGGFLWLDVEGHATKALQGAGNMLPLLSLAKIEVQMHDMNDLRREDFFEVCRMMKVAGLRPLYAPIHPGYFGDVVFVHKRLLTRIQNLYSRFLYLQMFLLHKIVYPRLGKPS
jgi:FkbM family methyltransferase